ncbi:hypothetical protein UlMin_038840 [Ulmus minor]
MAFFIFPLNLVQLFLFFGLQIHILANDHKIVLAKMIVQRPLAVQLVSKGLLDPNRWRRLLDNSSPREVTMDALMIVSDLARMDKGFYEYINRASVLEHMKDFLTHEDPHVRAKTCSALGNMCRHSSYFYNSFARYQIICLLIDRCSDPDKRTRKFACFAIKTHKLSDSFFIFLENVGKFGSFGVFYFQVKDIALKASEAYKNCKLCSGSSNDLQKRNCAEFASLLLPPFSNSGLECINSSTRKNNFYISVFICCYSKCSARSFVPF